MNIETASTVAPATAENVTFELCAEPWAKDIFTAEELLVVRADLLAMLNGGHPTMTRAQIGASLHPYWERATYKGFVVEPSYFIRVRLQTAGGSTIIKATRNSYLARVAAMNEAIKARSQDKPALAAEQVAADHLAELNRALGATSLEDAAAKAWACAPMERVLARGAACCLLVTEVKGVTPFGAQVAVNLSQQFTMSGVGFTEMRARETADEAARWAANEELPEHARQLMREAHEAAELIATRHRQATDADDQQTATRTRWLLRRLEAIGIVLAPEASPDEPSDTTPSPPATRREESLWMAVARRALARGVDNDVDFALRAALLEATRYQERLENVENIAAAERSLRKVIEKAIAFTNQQNWRARLAAARAALKALGVEP